MTTKATPRPWSLESSSISDATGRFNLYLIEERTGRKIGAIWGRDEEKADTGALIVRAVNAHDGLVAALRRLLATINPGNAAEHSPDCDCVIHEAHKALAKARGEIP